MCAYVYLLDLFPISQKLIMLKWMACLVWLAKFKRLCLEIVDTLLDNLKIKDASGNSVVHNWYSICKTDSHYVHFVNKALWTIK